MNELNNFRGWKEDIRDFLKIEKTWLKLLLAPRDMIPFQTSAETLASVVMTLSMVAMFGWIMPDPFAIPPILTVVPPISVCIACPLESGATVDSGKGCMPQMRKIFNSLRSGSETAELVLHSQPSYANINILH